MFVGSRWVLGSRFWVLGNLESGRGLRAAIAGRDVQEPRSPPQGGGGFLLCYTPAKDEEIMNSPDVIQAANGTRKVRRPA